MQSVREEIICSVFTSLNILRTTKTLKYEHDRVLHILLMRMLVGTLATQVPSPALMTKSSPGVPPVCWRVFALLFSSLSLSPDSHSVRPSVSQSAGQVWFGCRVQKKTHTQVSTTQFFFANILYPVGSCLFFAATLSLFQLNWKGTLATVFLPSIFWSLIYSGPVRGRERREGAVAFKSIWQTAGPSFHHLLITVNIFNRADYWGIRT